ncbi:hypothetical protein ABPG74_005690 [Tetrahymena malaccensis]
MSCCEQDFTYFCPKQKRKVFFDYYALLNISRDATEDQVKKAYRKFAMLYHPDKCNDDKKEISKEKFKIIADAYQNLLCPEKRSAYNSALLRMELIQNAKKQNPKGVCSLLQSCTKNELICFLVGSNICGSQPTSQNQKQQYFDCSEQSKSNNYYKNSQEKHQFFEQWQNQNKAMNSNNFTMNSQNDGFSEEENGSDESECEPQCQGSDICSNSSEQSFYQKFSFFNNIKTEQLNPENFTLLKGIFNNTNFNSQQTNNSFEDEISLRYKEYQSQQQQQQNLQTKIESFCFSAQEKQETPSFEAAQVKREEQLQERKDNLISSDYNCKTQQNDSINQFQQFNTKLEDIKCEDQNDDDILSSDKEEDIPSESNKQYKSRITKAQIKMLQKQNQNKKIIERIRNKKPVFSSTICKRIKKQN